MVRAPVAGAPPPEWVAPLSRYSYSGGFYIASWMALFVFYFPVLFFVSSSVSRLFLLCGGDVMMVVMHGGRRDAWW